MSPRRRSESELSCARRVFHVWGTLLARARLVFDALDKALARARRVFHAPDTGPARARLVFDVPDTLLARAKSTVSHVGHRSRVRGMGRGERCSKRFDRCVKAQMHDEDWTSPGLVDSWVTLPSFRSLRS